MDRAEPPFATVATGDRRPLRPVVQGDDAVDDQADLRRARRRPAEAPLHGRHLRRRDPPQPADRHRLPARRGRPARSRRSSSASAPTARSAPTRPRSRSSARAPTCTPRATSCTTRRSPARSPSRTCASAPSRSARPTSSTTPTSWPATSSGCSAKIDVLEYAKPGATFLLNAPYGPDEVWEHLPGDVQRQLIDKEIDFWVIDALAVAAEVGMGSRINTVMQPCFFQLAGVLPADEAISRIKGFVEKTYAKRGDAIVAAQLRGDRPIARAARATSRSAGRQREHRPAGRDPRMASPTSWRRSPRRLMAGDGDLLPVSALPVDGTFPTGTTKYEKRAIAQEIPIWDPDDLHRLRQVRHRLPARHDPDEGLPERRGRRGARPASCTRSSARGTCPTIA